MREELATIRRWRAEGTRFALATVVATSESAPRSAGATLALHPDGSVVGSVSGGCVEGAVVEVATAVLADDRPQRVTYGISDDEAMAVGLTCGGTIHVFVRAVTPDTLDLDTLAARIEADEPVAVATVVEHPDESGAGRSMLIGEVDHDGTLGDAGLDHATIQLARGMLAQGQTASSWLGARGERLHDEVEVLVESFAPRPDLLVFGATDHAAAVVGIGRYLGFRVTVCDARARFATPQRFPDADEVVVAWPHRFLEDAEVDARTAICVLTHDPKFDVPVIQAALRTDAAYIGAMGSRRTHEDRLRRLREAGVVEESLARLRSPVGLDLGARTPQETAVSIAAELLMERHGGSGRPLGDVEGPIHRDRRDAPA